MSVPKPIGVITHNGSTYLNAADVLAALDGDADGYAEQGAWEAVGTIAWVRQQIVMLDLQQQMEDNA